MSASTITAPSPASSATIASITPPVRLGRTSGRTPDLTTYRAVHTAIRRAPHRMAAAVLTIDPADRRRLQAFARYWHGYAAEVLMHHTVEDDVFFPALVRRIDSARTLIERTDEDHHILDELMTECAAAIAALEQDAGLPVREHAAELLRLLAGHMDEHLDFEDEMILPLISRHLSVAEYTALEEQVTKSMPIGTQAAFAVPFIVDAVDPGTRARLFAGAPRALRVLYHLCRRRHARLEVAALGR